MKVKIEIDTKTFIRFWLVVIGFALVGIAIYSARSALLIVGIAFFLAIALSPYVNKLAKILSGKKSHRVLSTALAYITVVLALGSLLFIIIPPVVEQMAKFAQNVPAWLDTITKQSSGLSYLVERYGLQDSYGQVLDSLKGSATHIATSVGSNLITGISSVASIVVACVVVFVLTFLMLVEGPAWIDKLWSMYHDRKKMERHRTLINKMYGMLTGYVTGQLSVAAIAGVAAGLMAFILSFIFNVSSSLAIPAGTIAFVMSLIPMFGAFIGGTVICLVLLASSFQAALVYLVFFVIYQQIEGNLIGPHIQSKRINLSPLVILIAITIGVYLFGILGGIISIPIAGCINILIEYFYAERALKLAEAKKSKTSQRIPK